MPTRTVVVGPATAGPVPSQRSVPRPSRATFIRRRIVTGVAVVMVLVMGWAMFTLGLAFAAPGGESAVARTAEWARSNHLGVVVNQLERWQYAADPPAEGGTVAGGVQLPVVPPGGGASGQQQSQAATKAGTKAAAAALAKAQAAAVLPTVPSAVAPPLPQEGHWATVAQVAGVPAVQLAYVRPDAEHTSYLSSIMWLDPSLLSFQLHPGTTQPGGTWNTPSQVPPDQRAQLMATFNSGFTLTDSRGGYYAEGRTVKDLRDGAASLVLMKNGTVNIGAWGRDIGMSDDVAAVRQNLDLMIDNKQIAPDIDSTNTSKWGKTLGNTLYVWRSGVGITETGKIVYVSGNALSTSSLAALLQRAGAVRAMELDINQTWVTGMWYEHPTAGGIVAHMNNSDSVRDSERYFQDTSRDFIAVSARQ